MDGLFFFIAWLVSWLILGFALAALAGCYIFARRRAFYQPHSLANERTDRIWHSAALFAGALIAPMAVCLLLLGLFAALIPFILVVGGIAGGVGLVLIIVIDLVAVKPLEAKRTKGWMIAAPIIFAFVFLGFLLVPLVAWAGGDFQSLFGIGQLGLLGDAAAAGLVWWAYLPVDAADLRRTFE